MQKKNNNKNSATGRLFAPTCVPNILHPHIGASCKEEPLNRYEQVADDIWCDGDADKEDRESLQKILSEIV